MKKSSKESIIEHVSLGRKLSKFIGEEMKYELCVIFEERILEDKIQNYHSP